MVCVLMMNQEILCCRTEEKGFLNFVVSFVFQAYAQWCGHEFWG
jgi:hypothetical protein